MRVRKGGKSFPYIDTIYSLSNASKDMKILLLTEGENS